MEDINAYLSENPEFNVESLIKFIYSKIPKRQYHQRIHYRKYEEDNLIQLFTESSQEYTPWPIFNVCRSIVIDMKLNKVISFSHPNIDYLQYSKDMFTTNTNVSTFTESHEGTLISVFYHNNKWYYGTRRQIDMYKTNQIIYGEKSELSHGEMFEEALSELCLTKETFESTLIPGNQYYIELVHYQNSFNISYTSRFGEKYAKLFLLFVRNSALEIVNINTLFNINTPVFNTDTSALTIPVNPTLDLDTVISRLEDTTIVTEGFIYMTDHICKIMHPSYYNLMKFNTGFKTRQEQYINLYQKNLLEEYATNNNKTVYKTLEDGQNIEIVGLMSCVFTYVGQRMLDIYYKFNNNKMVHRNEEEFKKLFVGNRNYSLIFHILGMMKGVHKFKPLNIAEMRKFLKYKVSAGDVWKLMQELTVFEETEKMLTPWTNPLIKMFL